MINRPACKAIEQSADALIDLATKIWENPEMGWNEYNAANWTAELMKAHGFEVEVGAYGVPTAVRAVWGHGHPVIGFCGEYDCLPGLSQKLSTVQDPVVPGGIGHGCGHNLLGVGCAAACIGLKAELEASGKEGTVIFYGCPAEEQILGKGYMALGGAFHECDLTMAWHPGAENRLSYGNMNGVEGAIVRFHGRTSHAASSPQEGRSAVDAAQLFNLGIEFMREHVTDDVRMHYAILDGGLAPNIVPDTSAVKFFTRALTRDACLDTFNRVLKCAEGAAIMTETTYEVERLGGLYPTLQNKVLVDECYKVLSTLPLPEYTEEELQFCDAINSTVPQYQKGVTAPISTTVQPLGNQNGFASTDYGDVMHIAPSVQLYTATACTLAGGHSWRVTSCSGSSVGMKGMLHAGKVMALASYEFCDKPELVAAAKAEFEEVFKTRKAYECPIIPEVKCPFNK